MPFATLGILDLLADRDAIAVLHEPAQILLARLHRHAGERHFGRAAVVARRERQAEHARRRLGVVVEHLVEVAHPEEQDRALMPRLDLPVLLHQRRRDGAAHGCAAPRSLGLVGHEADDAALLERRDFGGGCLPRVVVVEPNAEWLRRLR